MIYANTTSKYPSNFLKGVELVEDAVKRFQIPNENWPFPCEYRIGSPEVDKYYAEVWANGMDWQPTYWIVEANNIQEPVAFPFIIFNDYKDTAIYDFRILVESCLVHRRNYLWIKDNPNSFYYNDSVWPFLYVNPKSDCKYHVMLPAIFKHASQPPVEFLINRFFVPERCINETHWNNRDKTTRFCGCIPRCSR